MDLRPFFLIDHGSGKVRFTAKGVTPYQKRLARLGYDVRRLRTIPGVRKARQALFDYEMRRVAAMERGRDPELDRILAGLPGWDDA